MIETGFHNLGARLVIGQSSFSQRPRCAIRKDASTRMRLMSKKFLLVRVRRRTRLTARSEGGEVGKSGTMSCVVMDVEAKRLMRADVGF